MSRQKKFNVQRQRRAWRVRRSIRGTPERPRLCIVRSLKHTYAQVIDDSKGCHFGLRGHHGKGTAKAGKIRRQ